MLAIHIFIDIITGINTWVALWSAAKNICRKNKSYRFIFNAIMIFFICMLILVSIYNYFTPINAINENGVIVISNSNVEKNETYYEYVHSKNVHALIMYFFSSIITMICILIIKKNMHFIRTLIIVFVILFVYNLITLMFIMPTKIPKIISLTTPTCIVDYNKNIKSSEYEETTHFFMIGMESHLTYDDSNEIQYNFIDFLIFINIFIIFILVTFFVIKYLKKKSLIKT